MLIGSHRQDATDGFSRREDQTRSAQSQEDLCSLDTSFSPTDKLPPSSNESASCKSSDFCAEKLIRNSVKACGLIRHEPAPGESASNETDTIKVYLPGVGTSCKILERSVETLAHYNGSTSFGLNNNAEAEKYDWIPGWRIVQASIGVIKGGIGMLSSSWGTRVEREAVDDIRSLLQHTALKEKDIILQAHSQGSIILSNALEELRKDLPTKDWEKLNSHLKVKTYGALNLRWPEGVDVSMNVHLLDIPALGMLIVCAPRELLCRANSKRKINLLAAFGHGFERYLNNTASFEALESLGAKSPGKHFAHRVLKATLEGVYSDRVVNRMISKGLEEYGKSFARSLLAKVPNARIGKYKIPNSLHQQLMKSSRGLIEKLSGLISGKPT